MTAEKQEATAVPKFADEPCSRCGRPVLVDASFCAYCGVRLAESRPIEITLPPELKWPRELTGPCAILRVDERPINVRLVGREVAKRAGIPLYDATRIVNCWKGFIAWNLPPDNVEDLARALNAMDLRFAVVEMDRLAEVPSVEEAKDPEIREGNLVCGALSWDAFETIEVPLSSFWLVVAGCCESGEEFQPERGRSERLVSWTSVGQQTRLERYAPIAGCKRKAVLVDFITGLGKDGRRLRIEQEVAVESGTDLERPQDVYDVVYEFLRKEANIDRNGAVDLIAAEVQLSSALWGPFSFPAKKDFEQYIVWLATLKKFGLPLPRR